MAICIIHTGVMVTRKVFPLFIVGTSRTWQKLYLWEISPYNKLEDLKYRKFSFNF